MTSQEPTRRVLNVIASVTRHDGAQSAQWPWDEGTNPFTNNTLMQALMEGISVPRNGKEGGGGAG